MKQLSSFLPFHELKVAYDNGNEVSHRYCAITKTGVRRLCN